MSSDGEIRVLLVEDDALFAKVVQRALRRAPGGPFAVEVASNVSDAVSILSRGESDVAVVDLGLPDVREPLEAVDRLVGFSGGVPVVVLTGRDTETLALGAVKRGAHDFISKLDLSAETLGRAVRYAVERTRLFEQQRVLVSKNPDAILIVDDRGDARFVNPAARSMFGDHMEEALEAVGILLSRRSGEFDLDTERGRITLEAVVTEMFWTGQPAFLITVRDTTARNRTAELRAMIRHADKLASLGQLAADTVRTVEGPAIMAHDHLGRAQALCDAPEPQHDDIKRELDEVARGLQAITAYIGQLRDYGQVDRKITEIDVVRVAQLAIQILDRDVAGAVQTRLDAVPRVQADGGLLCHALVNVLSNAGDAVAQRTHSGQIVLSTWFDESHVALRVRDNGPGIPADQRDDVFRPFFTSKRPGSGAGLGLSVAADILRAHRGEIRLECEPGATTFDLMLPRTRWAI
jgi:signal transduction histidine kinase